MVADTFLRKPQIGASAAWDAPSPELLRMFIASLLALGIDDAEIRLMVQENSAKLLGLPSQQEEQ